MVSLGDHQSRASRVRDTVGRQQHAALAITYRSWEVSWGPWVSLLGCAWHWSSSSEPAQLQTAAWPSSCHLSSPGPWGCKGGKADAGEICPGMGYHPSWIRATRDPPASYPDSPQELPQVSPHAGICDVPVRTPSPITALATTAAQSLWGWQSGCAAFPCEPLASSTLFTARSGLVKKYVQLLCLSLNFIVLFPLSC